MRHKTDEKIQKQKVKAIPQKEGRYYMAVDNPHLQHTRVDVEPLLYEISKEGSLSEIALNLGKAIISMCSELAHAQTEPNYIYEILEPMRKEYEMLMLMCFPHKKG